MDTLHPSRSVFLLLLIAFHTLAGVMAFSGSIMRLPTLRPHLQR
jgi:hypothetical protein